MSMRAVAVNEQLKRLKVAWSVGPEFREVPIRKQSQDETEQKMLFDELPRLFFDDVHFMFQKYEAK